MRRFASASGFAASLVRGFGMNCCRDCRQLGAGAADANVNRPLALPPAPPGLGAAPAVRLTGGCGWRESLASSR
ncbi:hypothetical protein [Corynebacterium diphtheriae]|uniref:hypothetical protein n=1 Tax=Corynebacterium diphtheriae TaxID=1717 RepID=UPI001E41CEBE|nr:hypothetical protein [Corynebacterium diphtheriae]